MEDFELQFDKIDMVRDQTKQRKPFPGDFSFDKDGSLYDHKIEEVAYEDLQEDREEAEEDDETLLEAIREDYEASRAASEESGCESNETEDSEEFSDDFFESTDGFHSEQTQYNSSIQQVEEGRTDTSGYGLFQDCGDSGDDFQGNIQYTTDVDEDEYEDFADVFGDMEFEETEISVEDEEVPEEAEDTEEAVEVLPSLETEISTETEGTELALSETPEEDDDEEDVDFADVFGDMEFEETEIPVEDEEVPEEAEDTEEAVEVLPSLETEISTETEGTELALSETPEEDDDEEDIDFTDVFGDMEFEEAEILMAEEEPVPEISPDVHEEPDEATVTPVFVLDDATSKEEDDDIPTTAAVPKMPVSVTTWERARQRATVQESLLTYETEHFFAVEGRYMDSKQESVSNAKEHSTLSGITQIRPVDEPEIQPIWHVDEPEQRDTSFDKEISDEDLDYDDVFNDDVVAYRKKKRVKKIFKKIFKEFMLFLIILVSAVFLVVNFTIFVSRQNTVVGESMEPTLHGGERVYTTLLPYIFGEPEIGDIIVFDYSRHNMDMGYFHMIGEVLRNNRVAQWIRGKDQVKTDTYWIKRVVALPGDVVSFENDQFHRNGELVKEDYLLEQTVTNYPEEEITVPDGHVFVMGDNRNGSLDSRVIQCISTDIIIGKLWKKG